MDDEWGWLCVGSIEHNGFPPVCVSEEKYPRPTSSKRKRRCGFLLPSLSSRLLLSALSLAAAAMASPAAYLQPLQRAQSLPTPSPQPMDSGASPLGHHLSSSLCSPQVLDLERERQIRPNRWCRRGMIEAATSTRLLPCTGGGIGEERSSSHSRRGAGEREQQQPQQEAVPMKRWSVPSPPLSSSGRWSSQDGSTTPQRETTMGHEPRMCY